MTGDSEQFGSVCRNFTRTLAADSSRQRRTTVALDNAEIDDPVLIAELPNPVILTGEDGDDTATRATALAHPLPHDRKPLLLCASTRQQESLGEYHPVAAVRSASHASVRATS